MWETWIQSLGLGRRFFSSDDGKIKILTHIVHGNCTNQAVLVALNLQVHGLPLLHHQLVNIDSKDLFVCVCGTQKNKLRTAF